jgi:hypothetical protein
MLWLFFTIFGLVLFVPTLILFLIFNRFKNTILVLLKRNGSLVKVVITNKILELGVITKINGKSVKPIKIKKEEIIYGAWRRWIIKPEVESTDKSSVTDKEIENYLNNEDLLKLYLAGKFKDTLLIFLGCIILAVIIGSVVNGYLTASHVCIISQDNSTTAYLQSILHTPPTIPKV